MSVFLKLPSTINNTLQAHQKWLETVKEAQRLVQDDVNLQRKSQKFLRLKERALPPEVVGRMYASYCDVLNKMYDSYLCSLHLQRASYMKGIIQGIVKRMFELRNELTHIIVNDYIYVDTAVQQLLMTPSDIEIIVPYHVGFETRPGSVEELLQKMWLDAVKRKNSPQKADNEDEDSPIGFKNEEFKKQNDDDSSPKPSIHTVLTEEFIQSCIIQKMERYRQYYLQDFTSKSIKRRMILAANIPETSLDIKIAAAALIQKVYRKYMKLKRKQILDYRRDVFIGFTSDPFRNKLNLLEETHKLYALKMKKRNALKLLYQKEMERENMRLIMLRKEDVIDDITDDIKEWFKEWFYGTGFFPEYPYPEEGGTIMVVRGDYPTIEEKQNEAGKNQKEGKGLTKEQIKEEKKKAKAEEKAKALALKETLKKEAANLMKMRCNPETDPGYQFKMSEVTDDITNTIKNYFASWSLYDRVPPRDCAEYVYGYIQPILSEELMMQIHLECRQYVDELMRLELELLIKVHQKVCKDAGMAFPKVTPRAKPKKISVPKVLNVDAKVLRSLEEIFNLGIITKPTNKMKDIEGDINVAAYEYNIIDPDSTFPPPCYGDVRQRLVISCIFGSGVEPGAKRNKSVLLVGAERNGKSFLADCVAGEINAVKIDITPEVFSAVVKNPKKILNQVFLAARVFQPAVIFLKNIERVFAKKIPPEDRYLKAPSIKTPLTKLLKGISDDDKIIFIATCSFPSTAKPAPIYAMFNEIILVPRLDYATVQQYLYSRFQKIKSMPRNFCVQSLAQILQGYGFGIIVELFNEVMSPERIVRLNVTPFSPLEFLEVLMKREMEPVTLQEYEEYTNFALKKSTLFKEREDFKIINASRKEAYDKLPKPKEKPEEE